MKCNTYHLLKALPDSSGLLTLALLDNLIQCTCCYSSLATVKQQIPAQDLHQFQNSNEPVWPSSLTCFRQHRASLGTPPSIKAGEITVAALPQTHSLQAIGSQKPNSLLQTCWPCSQ